MRSVIYYLLTSMDRDAVYILIYFYRKSSSYSPVNMANINILEL